MEKSKAMRVAAIAVTVCLVAWLVGTINFIFGALGLGVAWFLFKTAKSSNTPSGFEEDALASLGGNLSVEAAQKMNSKYMKSARRHGELIRQLQILGDSIRLALNSKKEETARSRMALAAETYSKVQGYSDIQPERLAAEISRVYSDASSRFGEAVCLNVAQGILEKVDTVKTDKTKSKYLAEALEVLNGGLSGEAKGSAQVMRLAAEVEQKLSART